MPPEPQHSGHRTMAVRPGAATCVPSGLCGSRPPMGAAGSAAFMSPPHTHECPTVLGWVLQKQSCNDRACGSWVTD